MAGLDHPPAAPSPVIARLSRLDRLLPVWIGRRWRPGCCWGGACPG